MLRTAPFSPEIHKETLLERFLNGLLGYAYF